MAIQINFGGKLIKQLGAYVQTDLTAVRQVNGVSVGVIGMLGLAEKGPENTPVRILSHAEAVSVFGGGPLVEHIKSAFLGGAGEVIAVRIGNPTPAELHLSLSNGTDTWTFDVASLEKSKDANNIFFEFSVDDAGTPADDTDDSLVVTVFQRFPDLSVQKEVFVYPKYFTKEAVLVQRGDALSFVKQSIVDNVISSLPPGYTATDAENALIAALQDELFADDYVQIFHPNDPVPFGLVLYDILVGELFGHPKSRIIEATVNAVAVDNIIKHPDLFNQTPDTFYDGGTNSYRLTTIALGNITVANLIDNNSTVMGTLYALSGGSYGDDGTGYYTGGTVTTAPSSPQMQSWIQGLQALEEEDVNFVIPAYKFCTTTTLDDRETFFTAVASMVLSHVETMSEVHLRKRRVTVLGYPAPHRDTFDKKEYITKAVNIQVSMFANSDRVQYWVHPFFTSVFAGKEELLGGEFAASFIAGRHANRFPYESITFTPFSGIGATPLYDWNYQEKDNFISNRIAFVEKVHNILGAVEYRIHHNPTSWFGPVTQGYQEFVLRRVDDFVSVFLYKNVERQFIGRVSRGKQTADEIAQYVKSLLNKLRTDGYVVAYANVNVTPNEDKTVYYVDFQVQWPTEVKFIPITLKVTFDLA